MTRKEVLKEIVKVLDDESLSAEKKLTKIQDLVGQIEDNLD